MNARASTSAASSRARACFARARAALGVAAADGDGALQVDPDAVLAHRAAVNMARLRWISIVVAGVHLAHVLVLLAASSDSSSTARWRELVLGGHLAVGAVALGLFAGLRATRPSVITATRVTRGAAWLYLAFGAWLAGVDQLVTTNVTPLVVVAFGVAFALRLDAVGAAVGYLLELAIALAAYATGPLPTDVAASNAVNAVAITGVGWIASRILEGARVRELGHRLTLAAQSDELRRANVELSRLARTDSLTNLYNRRAFVERAAALAADDRAQGRPAALLILDLDHFKSVNDTLGHAAGDVALTRVARVLAGAVRTDDLVARLGGEEFAVYLTGVALDDALDLAEGLRRAVAAEPIVAGPLGRRVTVSIGVATLDTALPDGLGDALVRADGALYGAKNAGRDRVMAAV